MKEFRLKKIEFKKIQAYSHSYYNLSVMKRAMEMFQKHVHLSQGISEQRFFVDVYYQKKIKLMLFNFLMASSYEFSQKSHNIITLFDR